MASDQTFAGSNILIVDDEETNVILLQRMLARAGYTRLTSTTDSREVLRLVEDSKPDLILLDLMMPYIDGYEVLAQLATGATPNLYLPVLVLTADVSPQALQRALSAGARDFLTKPFDQTELLLRVHNLLETRHLYLALQGQLQSLEQINEDAMQSIVFRDQSLSAISHDIGQPLAALRFTTEGLQQAVGTGDKAVAEEVQQVMAATAQMTAMIAELSDLARLQMGRELVLQRSRIDLAALVKQQAAAARKTAGHRKIHVEAPAGDISGNWDGMRLARVVSNLLSNAVRFTPASGEVTITLENTTDGVKMRVADNGAGIPESELPHVFERFYRASNVSKIPGTGLGLASCRQIVEQHGGKIAIISQEGAGTSVTVSLPFA